MLFFFLSFKQCFLCNLFFTLPYDMQNTKQTLMLATRTAEADLLLTVCILFIDSTEHFILFKVSGNQGHFTLVKIFLILVVLIVLGEKNIYN